MKTRFDPSRKKIAIAAAIALLARAAFPQGTINFDNRANSAGDPTQFPGAVWAPFYGPDPADPYARKTGNTSAGVPSGTQVYAGPLLTGTNWSVCLWARNAANVTGDAFNNNLAMMAVTTLRTNTTGLAAGRTALLPTDPSVPDVTNAGQRGTFQVRVWDNRGGSIATWEQALGDPGIPRGFSDLFTVPFALGGFSPNGSPSPNLAGLESFNVFIVPEPSTWLLLGVGGIGLWWRLRRRA